MAINAGTQSFNISRDVRLRLIAPTGEEINLSQVTEFARKQETDSFDVPLLNSNTYHADLPKNWTGSITIARRDSQIDRMFGEMERQWRVSGNVFFGTLYAFIKEAGGNQLVEKFTNVSFKYDDAGTFSGDNKPVMQKIAWTAQDRDVQ